MTVSKRSVFFLGLVAALAPFGACSGYTNLGDPPAAGAGGDAGDGHETGGTGGPSLGSGGTSAVTGNGGSSTGRGGRATGGSPTGGGGTAGNGVGSSGGKGTGDAGPSTGGTIGSVAPDGSAPDGSAPDADAGVPADASTGDASYDDASMPPGDGGGDTGCELDACNDHGACIERERWSLCDCSVDRLPVCELPLFREIGPSRTNDELILVSVSGDGKTIVGGHRPRGSVEPKFGVRWTLDEGLVALPQDPAGPTVAMGVNFDASIIRGRVETAEGTILKDVVWRNGVLGTPSPSDDDPLGPPRMRPPTVAELTQLLVDLGIDARSWDIWVVNDISADGKVVFGLGLLPDRGARWLLRLP
ncbi:MAG TPA: hypothetical protein VFZ53_10415 [Polyangiaceae bacterium]